MSYKSTILALVIIVGHQLAKTELHRDLTNILAKNKWNKVSIGYAPENESIRHKFVEYVPTGQDHINYSSKVTVSVFTYPSISMTIRELIETSKRGIMEKFGAVDVLWKELKVGESDALYEWKLLTNSGNVKPQHEVIRISQRRDGEHLQIAYATNGLNMNTEVMVKWLEILGKGV